MCVSQAKTLSSHDSKRMLGEYVRQRTRELQLALFGHQEDAETEGARAVQDASEVFGVEFQETGDFSNDQGI